MNFKKITPIIYGFILTCLSFLQLLFSFRTNSYFSVDDFTVLAYFKNHTVIQMVGDFFLHGDVFHFRKIVGYVVFGTLFTNFGVSPDPYLISMFVVQSINLILLFSIIRFLTKNNFTPFLMAVIFNKFYMAYFANIHMTLGTMFCLIAIYLFLIYPKKIFLSLGAYVLALFSEELAYSLPFILLSLSFVFKVNRKKILPFFVILFLYVVYQAYFVFLVKNTPFIQSYGVVFNIKNMVSALTFYISPSLIIFSFLLPILTKKYKLFGVLIGFYITLLPVLFFGARRELYYLYLPITYLLIYFSLFLDKLNLKSVLICIFILGLFGGRSILPIIARQEYPNWQKVSIENIVNEVETQLTNTSSKKVINLDDIVLERDARLLLQTSTLDLFVKAELSKRYNFIYDQSTNSIIANEK